MQITARINGRKHETFDISSNGTTREFQQGDFVVLYGDPLLLDFGCTVSHPCTLTIVGEL